MDAAGKKVRKSVKGMKPFLPDEIITNILTRVPAKSAMRFRLACKGWRDLTFDRDFVELHLRNSIPTILVANPKQTTGLEFLALDKWWESSRKTKFMIHRFSPFSQEFSKKSRVVFSHGGLLVVRDQWSSPEPKFIILNLANHEHVRIIHSQELWGSHIFGVYYHPSLKEYCSLLKIYPSRSNQMQYKILNLGFNPSLKMVGNPFSNRAERESANPLFINNYLYWLLRSEQGYSDGHNDIMEFDIIREEFQVLPCPVPLNIECWTNQTSLLCIDGILCYLLAFPTKISIWRLESDKLWKSDEYALSIENCPERLKGIAFEDGMLALEDEHGRLLVCNLMEGNVKNYSKKKYNKNASYLSYHTSLASLKHCSPLISIDKDGEVVLGD